MFDTMRDEVAVPSAGIVDDPVSAEPVPLSEVPTSAWLGVELGIATEDPGSLSDRDLVDAIVGFERATSWAAARQAELLAEFARRRPTEDAEAAQSDTACSISPYAADEVALALRVARGTAAVRLQNAQRLDSELGETRQAWQDGRIDATKVRAILDATANLRLTGRPQLCTAVQDRVLGRASEQTAGQLRAALARAVIAVDPAGAAERHKQARRDRRVAVNPELDGMASLWALLPAPDALSAYEWLTRLARGMGAEDPRGMDARRADLLVALLTGRLAVAGPHSSSATTDDGAVEQTAEHLAGQAAEQSATGAAREAVDQAADPAAEAASGRQAGRQPFPQPVNPGKPLIQIVIPYDTLTGTADHPADLVGYGPIPAPLARQIAADGIWKRLVTDPLSGALLDYGRTTYRPPAALADFVRARDVHCRHPICRRRAIDSELDHTIAYAGDVGETSASNLYATCAHHHHGKHDAPGWSVVQHADGQISWTTPTGHTYASNPYDYRVEDEPDLTIPAHSPQPPLASDDTDPPF
jgi:hypothetical protein